MFRSLNPLNDLKALREAVKIIRKEKPDVIHCHSAKGGIIGRTAGWITGVKTFYTPHAFSYLCTPSKLKRWVFMTIERLTRFETYVLACSESEQEMAIKEVGYSKEHALVWHNGQCASPSTEDSERGSTKRKWCLSTIRKPLQ